MRSRRAVVAILAAITLSAMPLMGGRLSAESAVFHASSFLKSPPSSSPVVRSMKPKGSSPVSNANSTRTKDWACIRWNESRDNYTQRGGGAYQFEGTTWLAMTGLHSLPEASAPSVQNAAALKLYAYDLRVWGNGWHAWSTRFVCGLG